MLPLVISLFLLAQASTSAEERWEIRTFHKPNSVPFQEVRDILEDKEGGIWIATWGGGVTRVYGTEWKTFDELNGLPSNWVRSLDEDATGGVWIGTTRGLCRIHSEKIDVFSTDNVAAFPTNGVRAVKCLRDQSVWISFDDANVILSYQKDPDTHAPRWEIVADDWEVSIIRQTRDGLIWTSNCKAGGLRSYDGNRWQYVDLGKITSPLEDIFEDRRGTLFVLVNSSLLEVTKDHETSLIHQFEAPVFCADDSPSGAVYVGVYGSVLTNSQREWKALDIGGLRSNRKVLVTRDGSSLWIGTRGGLLHGKRFAWRRHVTNTEGTTLLPNSLCVSRSDEPLSIDDDRRINLFQQGQWIAQGDPIAFDGPPQFVLRDGPNQIWVLTDTDLYLVGVPKGDVERRVLVPSPMIKPSFVEWYAKKQLLLTSKGELRFITESGVYDLEGATWRRLGPPLAGDHGVSAAIEAVDGSFYVCYRNDKLGDGYVEHWNGQDVIRMGERFPRLRNQQFESACLCQDGRIWFGTHDKGILEVHGKSVREINMHDGLTSNLVSSIHEASDGTMWIGYRRKGVSALRDSFCLSFGESQGLPSWEIDRFGEDPNGDIWVSIEPRNRWFPSRRRGIYQFQPERNPPETRIVAYPTKPLSSHGIGVISFSGMDAWNETERDSLFYSWRFVPLASDRPAPPWSNFVSDASVVTNQTPLFPGQYRFEVRAADVNRNIDATPASITVTVALPIWRRPSTLVPVSCLCATVLVSLYSLTRKHISLRSSNQRLKQENDERMRAECERERLREQLHQSQKLDSLGTLASGVAHEFNNYLMAIVAYTEVIGMDATNCDKQGCLEGILKATDQATDVTRALQTFSRREGTEKRPVNLNTIVQQSLHMLRPMLPASIEIVSHSDVTSSLVVFVNATQIQQVIFNLAINGRDAMPHGGVLTVATSGDDESATLSIQDTGIGISTENQERVFDPFFTTKSRGQGMGLGLSIAHGIVQDHNGSLRVESSGKDRGTIVIVELPLCDRCPLEDEGDQYVEPVRGNNETVVVAEDHPEIRHLMCRYLEDVGYQVLAASDGDEVLTHFQRQQKVIQLIILDIDLPKRNGMECLREIQETHGLVPTILISGLSDSASPAEQFDHIQFLKKPFSLAALSGLVGRLLRAPQEVT